MIIEATEVTNGVPQGTALSLVLFTLYIHSLLTLETIGITKSVADETAIIYQANTWSSLKEMAVTNFKTIR